MCYSMSYKCSAPVYETVIMTLGVKSMHMIYALLLWEPFSLDERDLPENISQALALRHTGPLECDL